MEQSGGPGPVIRSVQRAFDLLENVAMHPDGRRLSELADEASINRSTAHNILGSLEALGYVTQGGRGAPYRLTGKLGRLLGPGAQAEQRLRARIRPFLEWLTAEYGETSYLAFISGNEYLCADATQSPQPLHLTVMPGENEPLLGTAIGHALLSVNSELCRTLQAEQPERWARYADEVELASRDGHALDLEKFHPGVSCLAFAISSNAAIAVAGPSSRLPRERLVSIAREIREAVKGYQS